MSADEPSHNSSGNNVRCKMLPGAEAGRADQGRKSVAEKHYRFVVMVLMGDYRSERKALNGMAGWERIAAVKKVSTAIAFQGALPAGGDFENFGDNQGVDYRLAAQQSGFAQLGLLGQDS
jgi:hypothetical protein